MPDYSMDDDPDYWQAPQRFRALFEKLRSLGIRASYFPLGDADNDSTPVAVVVEMQPGFVIMRHAHPCDRFEVIVRGTLETNFTDPRRPARRGARPSRCLRPRQRSPSE
jgi:hypothetical protein